MFGRSLELVGGGAAIARATASVVAFIGVVVYSGVVVCLWL